VSKYGLGGDVRQGVPFSIGDRVLYRRRRFSIKRAKVSGDVYYQTTDTRKWNPASSKLMRAVFEGRMPPSISGATATGTVVGIDLMSRTPVKVKFDKHQGDTTIAVGSNDTAWVHIESLEQMPAVDRLGEIVKKDES